MYARLLNVDVETIKFAHVLQGTSVLFTPCLVGSGLLSGRTFAVGGGAAKAIIIAACTMDMIT